MGYQPGRREVVAIQYCQMDAMVAMHDANRALRQHDYHTSRRALSRGQRYLRSANRQLRGADPVAAAFAAANLGRAPLHR